MEKEGQHAARFIHVSRLQSIQTKLLVFALLAIDAFIRFLVDGFTGAPQAGIGPWVRVLIGTLLWPILMAVLDRVRMSAETRPSDF